MTMTNIIELNLVEYAKLMNIFPQAVFYRLKANVPLPGVVDTARFRNLWILYYNNDTDITEAKKSFKIATGRGGNKKKKQKSSL